MKIAIVTPSGPPDMDKLATGCAAVLARWRGITFVEADNVRMRAGYLAGEDAARVAGVCWALEESGAEVVWFARGGFGTTRIVSKIPWQRLAARPDAPVLIGYSDATAFLAAWHARGGRAVHGPMLATDLAMGGADRTWISLGKLLMEPASASGSRTDAFVFDGSFLGMGAVSGRILAGNLTVLAALAGTRDFPSGEGCVICLEEVKEEPYRVDRLLTQLRAAGLFDSCAGVVFGSMKECVPEEPEKSFSLEEVIAHFARDIRKPVVTGLPFGHGGVNTLLPWGARIMLEQAGEERINAVIETGMVSW